MSGPFVAARWTTPPERSWEEGGLLHVAARARSDFWRDPRTGAIADDGHLLGFVQTGDVSCEVEVEGDLDAEYDQCGLMVRLDADRWVKVVLDVVDARLRIATVVTNGHSDSALQPFVGRRCWFRLTRLGAVVSIEARVDADSAYDVIRMARLPGDGAYLIGPVCCAPSRAGFVARFGHFGFGPPPARLVA